MARQGSACSRELRFGLNTAAAVVSCLERKHGKGMGQSLRDVLARYDAMREAALADAQHRLQTRNSAPLGIPIELSPIDQKALRAWREQWKPRPDRPGGWDWPEQRRRLASTTNRFEVALWSGHVLGGFAIGKPSRGPSHLAIQLLEGNPAEAHPLKGLVAECVIEAGISYARLLGKGQLRLIQPLPGALPTYRRLKFKVEPESAAPPYCFLEI
jgi:hypothetical protein